MSRDTPIEKIRVNTGLKLSFTSPSIEELASSFQVRTDGHQSRIRVQSRFHVSCPQLRVGSSLIHLCKKPKMIL